MGLLLEIQFVRLPPSMNSEEHQKLFPCNQHQLKFPGLTGVSFQILKETSNFNALCAWVGRNCTFNAMVRFMHKQGKDHYRFSTLTAMLLTPERRKISRYSTSFHEGRIVIIGPRDRTTNLSAMQQILGPFRKTAWATVCSLAVLLVILAVVIELIFFGQRQSFLEFLSSLVGERTIRTLGTASRSVPSLLPHTRNLSAGRIRTPSDETDCNDLEDLNSQLYIIVRWTFFRALLVFLAITVIFYEAGVVNFLFQQSKATLKKNLSSLSRKDLSEFGIQADQAVEDIFRDLVDPGGLLSAHNFPWYRCQRVEDCFQKLLNPNDQVKFVVSSSVEAAYLSQLYSARSMLASYEPEGELYSFTSSFLHNVAVPEPILTKLDIDLLNLRKMNYIRKLIKSFAGEPLTTEGEPPSDIDGVILLIVFAIGMFPFLILIALCLVYSCVISRRKQKKVLENAGP